MNFPPIARQFFFANICPNTNFNEPWGLKVESLLDDLCGTREVLAEIDCKGNAVVYFDSEVYYLLSRGGVDPTRC